MNALDKPCCRLSTSVPNIRAESIAQPGEEEQEALLAFFAETTPDPPAAQLVPVAMTPPLLVHGVPIQDASADALTMTALQQWAASSTSRHDADDLERTWFERRRSRRSERIMLNAALYVSAALIIGAFAFLQLEDAIATHRAAVDLDWQASKAEHQAQVQRDEREALAITRTALSQSHWTGLLPYLKDARQHLAQVRDHYIQEDSVSAQQLDLKIVATYEGTLGLDRLRIHVDVSRAWKSSITLVKVEGTFKLDWESFQESFESYPNTSLMQFQKTPAALPYLADPTL